MMLLFPHTVLWGSSLTLPMPSILDIPRCSHFWMWVESGDFIVPRCRTSMRANRSFSRNGQSHWSSLPLTTTLHCVQLRNIFKTFKTHHLFKSVNYCSYVFWPLEVYSIHLLNRELTLLWCIARFINESSETFSWPGCGTRNITENLIFTI